MGQMVDEVITVKGTRAVKDADFQIEFEDFVDLFNNALDTRFA